MCDERSCLHFVGNNSVTHYGNVNRSFVGFVCAFLPHRNIYLNAEKIQTAAGRKKEICVVYAPHLGVYATEYLDAIEFYGKNIKF